MVGSGSFTKTGDAIENEFGGGIPDERFWIFVVGRDVIIDGRDEFVHVFEDAAPDALFGDLGKPAFHLIEPRTAGGREMQVVGGRFLNQAATLGVLCVA